MCSKISVESGVLFGHSNVIPLEATLSATLLHGISQSTLMYLRWKCVSWSVNQLMYSTASAFCDWFRNGTRFQPSNNTAYLGFDSWEGAIQEPSSFPRKIFSENGANPKDALGNWRQWFHYACFVVWDLSQWVFCIAWIELAFWLQHVEEPKLVSFTRAFM